MTGDGGESLILAAFADAHSNSMTGLCPPVLKRRKRAEHHATPVQVEIWEKWNLAWAAVGAMRQESGARVLALSAGDLGDKNKHGKVELISHHDDDILSFCELTLEPVLAVADVVIIGEGTEAHSGGGHWIEHAVASRIGAAPCPRTGDPAWDWIKLDLCGRLFDVQHHPQTSTRRRDLRDQAASRQAGITRNEYFERGESPPDVVLRAHVHYRGRGYTSGTYCEFLRPWQMTNAFGNRLGNGGELEPVGISVFRLRGGEMIGEPIDLHWAMDRREPWDVMAAMRRLGEF